MKAIHCQLSFLFAPWLVAGVGVGTGDNSGIEESGWIPAILQVVGYAYWGHGLDVRAEE